MDQLFQQYQENLEFPQFLELLQRLASCEGGRRDIRRLAPLHQAGQLEQIHRLVAEIRKLQERGDDFTYGGLPDLQPVLDLLGIENATVSITEILEVHQLVLDAVRTRRALLEAEEKPDVLLELGGRFPPLAGVAAFIESKVDPGGEIPDRASPELASVRRQLRSLSDQIQQEYQTILERSARRGLLQDHYVTVRNSRFVIPLKSDAPGAMKGVVHGSSSSGMTLYVEPMELVPLNNRFTALREREEEIIQEILALVASYLHAQIHELRAAFELISLVDSLAARARFAVRANCVVPRLTATPELVLEDARHPLLEESLRQQGKSIVPVSLSLTGEAPCLIISGPNTGGKTAALKAAGLLSLMALSGIPVPARNMSCGLFRQVFAAIGDQQSLSGDLSTFSSHILFLRHMAEHYQHPSLILVDELGTGTDPEEGSALAMAFLEYFQQLQAPVIVTTHSQALKEYALTTAGTGIAAVEIHPDTLAPTYRLRHGVLGGSSGLFIARRLGMPEAIIQAANRRLSRHARLSDEILSRLNALVHQREEELAAITRIKHDHILKKIQLERHAEEKKRDLVKRLHEDFDVLKREFLAEKKQLFKELREQAVAAGQQDRWEQETSLLLKRVERQLCREAEQPAAGPPGQPLETLPGGDVRPGMPVHVEPLHCDGVVLEAGSGEVLVRAGDKRLRIPAGWLRRVVPGTVPPETGPARPVRSALTEPDDVCPAEINVIGQSVDDVLPELDRFLDQAFRQEMKRVAIVHGMGKGILKTAIHQRLKELSFVRAYHHPPQAEGGTGKTVVELDV